MQTKDTSDGKDVIESVRALQEDFGRFKADITGLLKAVAREGNERTINLGREVLNASSEKIEHLREMGACKLQRAEERIANQPLASVILAAGIGLLVGKFLRK